MSTTRTIRAAGVTFTATGFDGYFACDDCGEFVAGPETTHGIEPSEHVCSV